MHLFYLMERRNLVLLLKGLIPALPHLKQLELFHPKTAFSSCSFAHSPSNPQTGSWMTFKISEGGEGQVEEVPLGGGELVTFPLIVWEPD